MRKPVRRPIGRRFWRDTGGNVAMITALGMIPLTLASLGAVDVARGLASRVELQDALDAAALAAGRSSTQDQGELQQIGQRILQQNLTGAGDFTVTTSSFTFGEGGKVVARAEATFKPLLGGLAGSPNFVAETEVKRANSILEIAMVLDNTGSMSFSLGSGGSKISYLRTAAKDFVDIMAKAAEQSTTSNAVRIALVPFSNTVNVGSGYRNAAWMDQNGLSPIDDEIFTRAQGSTQDGDRWAYFDKIDAWRGCVEMRQAPHDVTDAPPSDLQPATLITPMFAPDEYDGKTNDYLADPTKDEKGKSLDWWARQGDLAKYSKTPKVTVGTGKGPNAGCGMEPVQTLTTDFAALKTSIGNMKAGGETNIPIGLQWGWFALSPNAPFAHGVPYLKPKHKKIVVLMTDGDNTMLENDKSYNNSTYSAAGFVWQGRFLQADGTPLKSIGSSQGTRTAAMNSRMKLICANMKAAAVGIEIYAVGVGVSSSSKALLQECASGADHYFDVTAGADLTATFQTVANQIAQLHLAK